MAEQNMTQKKVSQWLLVAVSALGGLYLLAIPLGIIPEERRFGLVEVGIFLILLLLNAGFFQRLIRLGISEKGVDLELQVQEVQKEQKRQKEEIDSLRFLISYFVTDYELSHLNKLATEEPFPFTKSRWFTTELRRLRSLGLIENRSGKTVSAMPEQGDLRDFFRITDRGRTYLQLRQQVDADGQANVEPEQKGAT